MSYLLVQQTLDTHTTVSEKPKSVTLNSDSRSVLKSKLKELTSETRELGPSVLISATYDGERKVAQLKFYEPITNRVYLWSDPSGHKPHCFSKQTVSELEHLKKERSNILDIVSVRKRDLLKDEEITVSKIIASDPLAIGGQDYSLRNSVTVWEADIKYYENYLYDNELYVGAFYKIEDGKIVPAPFKTPPEVEDSLKRALQSAKPEMAKQIEEWASLLNQPLPYLKRAALDIEVLSLENRIPNADLADQPIVAVSLVSDKFQRIYVLERKDVELGNKDDVPKTAELLFFQNERDLLISLFTDMLDYPFIATFNGDDFDLNYLYHRAQRAEIGLTKEEIPIVMGNNFGGLKHGVHIDLYKTFNNRSLQIYAFGNKYSDHTLNGVAEGLLDESKVEFDGQIGDLPIYELAKYNLQDTILTYKLVSIYNDVLLKLLVVIARVGKMPIDDLSRLGVSNWIRSMLYFEHRRQNALIPRPEELKERGGAKSEAIIKGKKYKGGLVIDPISGVHFNVSVLDFASLYPSIIKVHNISYETVNCVHEQCRKNMIPEVGHWTCTKNRGIESLVVGSLRDLRVEYYKQLTKSKTLSKQDLDLYKVVSQGLKVILNACFTGDTEILTTNGIKNIKDVRIGDRVINVNPDTMTPEIDIVSDTQVFHYDDFLYHFRNGKQVDLKVTKNHRFLVKQGQRPTTFLEAEEIESWTNISIPKLQTPKIERDDSMISIAEYRGNDRFTVSFPIAVTNHHVDSQFSDLWEYASKCGRYDRQSKSFLCDSLTQDQLNTIKALGGEVCLSSLHSRYAFEFKRSDFAELCGWLISEGHVGGTPEKIYENGNHEGVDYQIQITQELGAGNKRGEIFRDEIRKLLNRMNLRYKECAHGFRIANPALHRFCVSEIRKGAKNKQIPRALLESSLFTKLALWTSLCKGDGSLHQPLYTTASGTLADQVCCLLAELGFHPRKFYDKYGVYRVMWCNSAIGLTESGKVKQKWLSKERFSGLVYCLTTRNNHTVFAGRNGIFAPVGQSYGVLGFESFPLYCVPAAEAVASLGRYSISKTIEECKKMGIEVIYSDTDSLFIKAPSQQQIDQVTSWTQKELGIEIEVDKIYRYVAMSQRKKNYFGVLQDGTVDIKGLTGKKSVSGDTPILAKVHGHVVFSTVEKIYEEYISGKSVELLAVSDDLRTEWSVVNEASKHRVTDVYLLKTSKGRNLKLSGDHGVYLIDQLGRLSCKETKNLRVGDVMIGAQFTPANPVTNEINLARYLRNCKSKNGQLYSSSSHSTTGIPIPGRLILTKDLMFLFGIFTAEGSISGNPASRNNMITQSSEVNHEVYLRIKSTWLNVFGFRMKEYARRNNSSNFYLPVLHAKLFQEVCGGSSARKHVPDFIFDLPLDLVSSYLLGLFSGDGFSNGKRINLASASHTLVEQVAYLLTLFDIDSRIRKTGGKYFQLSIIGTSSRVAFQTKIGFLQERSQKIPNGRTLNKELLPIRTAGLIELKKSILKRKGLSRFRYLKMHDNRYYNMMLAGDYNKAIDSLLTYANEEETGHLMRIRNMINSRDVSYDEVVSIERLRGEEIMYDFASPKYQRFVAGNLPTLLHNSQTPEFIKASFNEILVILSRVKSQEDFEQAREDIKKRLTGDYNRLKNKEISMDDLAFNVMISKEISSYRDTIPQHVRAAQVLKNSGKDIKAGDIISFVKTTTGDGAKPASIARKDEIDVEKYLDYMRSTFDQILGSLGYDFDEILGATKLEDFFWPAS